MVINLKKFILYLALPLITGGLSAFISRGGIDSYAALSKPPLSPPAWLFPVVWTILFLLMGISSYLVSNAPGSTAKSYALRIYFLQLFVNFLWPIFFFNFKLYFFSFLWLILLWFLILGTILSFSRLSKLSAYLLIPYLLWVTFAGYLNFAVYILNRA